MKRDALNALLACIQSYDPDTVSKYSITIWDVLKFEILNAQEEFLAELSLEGLCVICTRLSEGVTEISPEIPLAQFLKPITTECNEQLQEPQQKQAKPVQQILSSTSAASVASFSLVVQTVVEPLLATYQKADGIAKQRALLETLTVLFESAITIFGEWSSRAPGVAVGNFLAEFKDRFSDIFSQALMGAPKEEMSFRVIALKGLLRLAALRGYFQDNEIGIVVQYVDEILLAEESTGRDDLNKECIAALAEISKHKPHIIMDITFPVFVAKLPDYDDGSSSKYLTTLERLAQISVEREIFDALVRRLLSKLTILLQKDQPGSAAYPRAILMTILYVMDQRKMDQDPNLGQYYDKIVVGLCQRVAASASGQANNGIFNDATVLDTLGRLGNLIVRCLPRQKQEEVVGNVYTLFTAPNDFFPVPFSQSATEDQRRTMIISTYLLAGLPKDCTNLPYTSPDMSALLSDLSQRSITESERATQLAFLRHLSLLVNKFLSKTDLSIPSDLFDRLISCAENKPLDPGVIKTVFWVSKALVLRLAPTTTDVLTSLLSLVSSADESTSTTAARGFSILLADDDILSPTNGATIRLLCKQRVFTTVIPLISTRIREVNTAPSATATTHIKPAHLTALSGILATIPSSLVLPELPTLLPLLLQSLDLGPSSSSDSTAVRTATLETLAVMIRENGVAVIDEAGHVQSLVTRLLNTTAGAAAGKAVNTPRLRVDALRCLYLLAAQPQAPALAGDGAAGLKGKPSPLLPVKNQVLRALRLVLDDPKRDVRKAAVDARAAWLRGVDDVEEEDE